MGLMEEDTTRFLRKIVASLIMGLLWLFLNMTVGIYMGWFFFRNRPTTGNYIGYGIALASLIGLLMYYRKIWKEKFPHG